METKNEQAEADAENDLAKKQMELFSLKTQLETTVEELEESKCKIQALNSDVSKLRETANRLESENLDYRKQCLSVTDERDELSRLLERKNNELLTIQEANTALAKQAKDALSAKFEALLKIDGVDARQANLESREKRMEQERELLNSQIQCLNEDLAKHASEVRSLRVQNATRLITLEAELSKKKEEVAVLEQRNDDLLKSNGNLQQDIESVSKQLLEQRESETKLQEKFSQELRAQMKLANLYKTISEEEKSKSEEFMNQMKELELLLKEAQDEHSALLAKMEDENAKFQEVLTKREETISHLQEELERANELIQAAKAESFEKSMEMSPEATHVSKLLKSGMTTTQLYMQYADVSEKLLLEKENTRKLNLYLNTIVKEIEEKSPILQQQRREYEMAVARCNIMKEKYDEAMSKVNFLNAQTAEAIKESARLSRENKRHQDDKSVLSRQVCFLMKELKEARTGVSETQDISSMDISSSNAEELVTFSSIEELQENNLNLLRKVRELSSKTDDEETESAELKELKVRLDSYVAKIEHMNENNERFQKMMDTLLRQRDMYRNLYTQAKEGKDFSEASLSPMSPCGVTLRTAELSESSGLAKELAETRKALEEAKAEAAAYRAERQENEKQLTEQLESTQSELHNLRTGRSTLMAQAEYSDRCQKTLKENADIYRAQVDALEKRNSIYLDSLAKYEQSIISLKDEAIDAQKKLAQAEVRLENALQECELLRESNARLQKAREMQDRESHSQANLLANLEVIRTSLERAETESNVRMETRLDNALRECAALRRRLEEEENNFRELTKQLKHQLEVARQREEEERKIGQQARTELISARTELNQLNDELIKQQMKVKELSKPPEQDVNIQVKELTSTIKKLELELLKKKNDYVTLEKELSDARLHMEKYCDISQTLEQRIKELAEDNIKMKEESEHRYSESSKVESELKSLLEKKEEELSILRKEISQPQVKVEQPEMQNELKNRLDETLALLETQRMAVAGAEEKYANEVMLHSQDLKTLTMIRDQLNDRDQEFNKLKLAVEQAKSRLIEGRTGWEEQEKLLKTQLKELQLQLTDTDTQNGLLHNQIEALSNQLAIAEGQKTVEDNSLSEEQAEKYSPQLFKIIKFLRREKDIAVGQFDVLRTENLRIKAQLENSEQQLGQIRKVQTEKKHQEDVNLVSASKHAELLRKLDTLSAITDSNVALRAEREELTKQIKDLRSKVETLEGEVGPLRKDKGLLANQATALEAENASLRTETSKLRQRMSALIERANKVAPEEWKRLKTEREQLKQDLTRIEAQSKQQADEISRLTKELAETRTLATKRHDELAKITEELGAKEALLTDIRTKEVQVRKIAKKYKTQFEELTKATEEEKKRLDEEQKKLALEPLIVPAETQELFREEGRKEMELRIQERIQEADLQNSDKLKELTDKVTSSNEEVESLRKENVNLKSLQADKEERARNVLKQARQKIMQLTDTKNALSTQLAEAQKRIEVVEQTKEEDSARLISLKSQYEGRIVRLEKENAELRTDKQRESDLANQKLMLLQRQLEKYQGSKPSTSSGSTEKSTSEPPTANIKPMAGPSSSPKTPQVPQSVTLTPWPGRGETPFASIRPMSQSRTVAVLPTAAASSYSNQTSSQQATAVLVPPQQQAVHSSGPELLSSSPTSSHTDYMPATSSAGNNSSVRQATVNPTVSAPTQMIGVESTQDIEAEAIDTESQCVTDTSAQTAQGSVQQLSQHQQQQAQSQQQQQQQLQQQTVALVSPLVEVPPEQTASVSASSQASSSSTVTTSQAGHKRPRESEDHKQDEGKGPSQTKRTRPIEPTPQEMFQTVTSDSGLEVEYQVPTSSQHDQEDDIVISGDEEDDEGMPDGCVMEEADDGPEFDDEADNGEDFIIECYDRDDQELSSFEGNDGPDIDTENHPDEENNEVEVMEERNEVPNQSGGDSGTVADSNIQASGSSESHQQSTEATSSGSVGGRGTVPTLARNQLQLLGFEEVGDDSIVPSTPTLFVPRRSDGFSEAVSSPQVPQGRFTFSETHPTSGNTARAGLAQVASEGMDDTRMDLTQLEEGTGRSVPTTPLQVSPQEDSTVVEMSAEVGQSGTDTEPQQQIEGSSTSNIPTISVTDVSDETDEAEAQDTAASSDNLEAEEGQLDQGDGEDREQDGNMEQVDEDVTSADLEPSEAVEEGREAEATEQPSRSTRSSRNPGRVYRPPSRGRNRSTSRPTPIVWTEPGSSVGPASVRGRACMMRGDSARAGSFTRTTVRGRRMRGKPKATFTSPYQMRF